MRPAVRSRAACPSGAMPSVPTSTSASTRSGASQATVARMWPPSDVPTSTARSAPISSSTAPAKAA